VSDAQAVHDDAAGGLSSVSEEEVARELAERSGLKYVDVASFAPDPEPAASGESQ